LIYKSFEYTIDRIDASPITNFIIFPTSCLLKLKDKNTVRLQTILTGALPRGFDSANGGYNVEYELVFRLLSINEPFLNPQQLQDNSETSGTLDLTDDTSSEDVFLMCNKQRNLENLDIECGLIELYCINYSRSHNNTAAAKIFITLGFELI